MQQYFVIIRNALANLMASIKPSTEMEETLMSIGAAVGLCISLALGGIDKMVWVLITFSILDYITGVIAACKNHKWESSVGRAGLWRKAAIFAVVAICNGIDITMETHAFRQMAICAYTLNEAGSIFENLDNAGCGFLVPPFVRKWLARLQQERGLIDKDDKLKGGTEK